MRESDEFSDVKYWASFVLIGDDVKEVTRRFPCKHAPVVQRVDNPIFTG